MADTIRQILPMASTLSFQCLRYVRFDMLLLIDANILPPLMPLDAMFDDNQSGYTSHDDSGSQEGKQLLRT